MYVNAKLDGFSDRFAKKIDTVKKNPSGTYFQPPEYPVLWDSGTSFIQTSNIRLLGLFGLRFCVFYLMLTILVVHVLV